MFGLVWRNKLFPNGEEEHQAAIVALNVMNEVRSQCYRTKVGKQQKQENKRLGYSRITCVNVLQTTALGNHLHFLLGMRCLRELELVSF